MIYFTADQHFSHANIIRYCNRPFSSVSEMDETMIARWNERVKPKDAVYVLGDFIFKRQTIPVILPQLSGQIKLIPGDHDSFIAREFSWGQILKNPHGLEKVEVLPKIHELKINGQIIILCHYCLRVWPKSHYNSWHLFGHSHGRLEPIGKSLDVGVDGHNFYPYSFGEIEQIMANRLDNPNLVRNE